MTQKAMLCKSLLKGEVISIMVGFKWFSITNVPREVSRQIEKPFGVMISRNKKDFKSRYGQPGYYFEYRLNFTEYNKEGIELMKQYVEKIENQPYNPPVKRGPKVLQPKLDKQSTLNLFDNDVGMGGLAID